MTPDVVVFLPGQPAREIIRRGFEPVAEIVRCLQPPRLGPPPPTVPKHFRAPFALPRVSAK